MHPEVEAYADQEHMETERWVTETLRNASVIAAGLAQREDAPHVHEIAKYAWQCYARLEQLAREAAP